MKCSMFLQFVVFLILSQQTYAQTQEIYRVTPDQANNYGIFSYNITEERSPHKPTQYKVSSSSAGVSFLIIEGSSNGSRQLKSALQKPQALRKETQDILFKVGVQLSKAQKIEDNIRSRFDDFEVEANRLREQVGKLDGKVPSLEYEQLANYKPVILGNDQISDINLYLNAYEYLLKLATGTSVQKIKDVISSIHRLNTGVERTSNTLNQLKSNLERDQQEFLSFVEKVEEDNLVSQTLKIRSVTIYLRGIAQTLNAYIGQTQFKIDQHKSLVNKVPKIDKDIENILADLQGTLFALRKKATTQDKLSLVNAIDAKYDVFYTSTGSFLKISASKDVNHQIALAKTNSLRYICRNRVCNTINFSPLSENTQYGYAVLGKTHILMQINTLEALLVEEQNLANLAKTLSCVGGFSKFKAGAGYVSQGAQIFGWAVVGGIGESAVNLYRWGISGEPTNYNYTTSKINQNTQELEQEEAAYKRMQEIQLQAMEKFMTEFQAPLEELTTDSQWAESLQAKSTLQCETILK